MMIDYEKGMIQQLARDLKGEGFRVFIAERGTYGFYTNAEGSRVVSFGADLGGVRFSGLYKTNNPRSTGNGWRLDPAGFAEMLNAPAPQWALNGASWKPTTLAQYLADYQSSSKFTEV